ncbi:MAG: phosphoenolpyruvate--protein phosphotransferase [Verrucomicrobiia bacterium]
MRRKKANPPSVVAADIRLTGIPVSPGVVHGPLVCINREDLTVPERPIQPEEVESEVARLEMALVETRTQLNTIREHLAASIGEKDAAIFDAHLLVLEDTTVIEAVKRQLAERLICVEAIYKEVTAGFAESLGQLDDPYLAERAADIKDIAGRVLGNLLGKSGAGAFQLEEPSIILAHDLTPGDTATLDRKMVLGFATEVGGRLGHTAIMARSLNLPAVVGLRDALNKIAGKTEVILDGYEGVLILNPSEKTKFEYGQIELRRHRVDEELEKLRETLAITRDHRRIILSANAELPEDLPLVAESGAEGIGLYRTEFMFLNRLDFPNEQEQLEVYERVVAAAAPHLAIIRTLDVGGDKLLATGEGSDEANPFLGWRAIRYCLEHRDVFRTQLRAILRAARGQKIRIMFPMISNLEEVFEAKAMLQDVRHDLFHEGHEQASVVEVGMMVEVPSVAVMAEMFAPHVDFFSIGTNDLVQYTLAVDRTNERVASLYQPTHPAILRLMRQVIDAAHAHNIWVGVCGEMAGELSVTPLLVGLGVDELSMGSVVLPRVKRAIQSLDYGECRALAEALMKETHAADIARKLEDKAEAAYGDLLE